MVLGDYLDTAEMGTGDWRTGWTGGKTHFWREEQSINNEYCLTVIGHMLCALHILAHLILYSR